MKFFFKDLWNINVEVLTYMTRCRYNDSILHYIYIILFLIPRSHPLPGVWGFIAEIHGQITRSLFLWIVPKILLRRFHLACRKQLVDFKTAGNYTLANGTPILWTDIALYYTNKYLILSSLIINQDYKWLSPSLTKQIPLLYMRKRSLMIRTSTMQTQSQSRKKSLYSKLLFKN